MLTPDLRMVAWELTRACNLKCAHCRASADRPDDPEALPPSRCLEIVDQILDVGRPVIILTGGEPLLHQSIFDISGYASGKGLRVVLGTNGTLLDRKASRHLRESGVTLVGVSLDYPMAELEDEFRGVNGAFDMALQGIENARAEGLSIQINSTITQLNVGYLNDLLRLVIDLGASAFHPFLLVPTGRGKQLENVELSPKEYESVLGWVYDRQVEYGDGLFIKPTDAPHYQRIIRQKRKIAGMEATESSQGHYRQRLGRGCLAGTGFCFISHTGTVQGCGYLNVPAGHLVEQSFGDIWRNSPLFEDLRDLSKLRGKCGCCEFKQVCGGCRARAYEASGDYLEAEPYCVYHPTQCGAVQ